MHYETIEYKCLMEWRQHEKWEREQELRERRKESGLPVPQTIQEFKPGQIFEEWGQFLYTVKEEANGTGFVSLTLLAISKTSVENDRDGILFLSGNNIPGRLIPVRREHLPLYLGGDWYLTKNMELVLKGGL